VSLDAPRRKIFEETGSHGWNLEKLCNEGSIILIDGSPFTRLSYRATGFKVPERRFTVQVRELCDEIRDAIKSINSKRISVDTLAALTVQFPDIVQRREAILELFEAASKDRSTAIITDETRQSEEKTTMLEEYLADGLILLRSSQVERAQVRTIEVEKIKASAIDDQIRPYVLVKGGFSQIKTSSLTQLDFS